jgi:4-hydroxy-2-oxoheptanedioate aldolase
MSTMPLSQKVPPNVFKQNLKTGTKQVGLWLGLDAPMSTEICAGVGYDWLLLDMEHACIDVAQVLHHSRAARGGSAEMVVRVPSNDAVLMKRLLDGGIRSFMIPMVNSVEDARRAVAATRYPPHGIRGAAGNTRATAFNRYKDYFERYAEEQLVIAQIESLAAVDAIEGIAAVDGIDALFIGPNDLSTNMGYQNRQSAPEVQKVIADVLARTLKCGKAPGILNFVPAEARAFFDKGFSFVAVGADGALLARRAEALLQEFRPVS